MEGLKSGWLWDFIAQPVWEQMTVLWVGWGCPSCSHYWMCITLESRAWPCAWMPFPCRACQQPQPCRAGGHTLGHLCLKEPWKPAWEWDREELLPAETNWHCVHVAPPLPAGLPCETNTATKNPLWKQIRSKCWRSWLSLLRSEGCAHCVLPLCCQKYC